MSAGEPLWWYTSRILTTETTNDMQTRQVCPSCGAATCPHCGRALPAAKPLDFNGPIWIVPPYTVYPYPMPYPYAPYVVNQGSSSSTSADLTDGITVTYHEPESE